MINKTKRTREFSLKRVIALSMSLLMFLIILSGCDNGKDPSENGTTTVNTDNIQTQTTASPTATEPEGTKPSLPGLVGDVGPYTGTYQPDDSKVEFEGISPDWVKSLVVAQIRIETITPEGTFNAAFPKLEYLQDLGVNAIWVSPVFKKSPRQDDKDLVNSNGFDLMEPDELDPRLGTMEDAKKFIDEAHSRDIRVFFDVVPHGVSSDSRLVKEHPEWFRKDFDGSLLLTWGNMHDFNFSVPEAKQYWIDTLVYWVEELDIDGYRCDLEPNVAAAGSYAEVRRVCAEKGKKIIVFSEGPNIRGNDYDFEQNGVELEKKGINPVFWRADYFLDKNIVDAIEKGEGHGSQQMHALDINGVHRFYTFTISNHDSNKYSVQGNRLKLGYLLFL